MMPMIRYDCNECSQTRYACLKNHREGLLTPNHLTPNLVHFHVAHLSWETMLCVGFSSEFTSCCIEESSKRNQSWYQLTIQAMNTNQVIISTIAMIHSRIEIWQLSRRFYRCLEFRWYPPRVNSRPIDFFHGMICMCYIFGEHWVQGC